MDGKKFLYYAGRADYQDIFDDTVMHKTMFCFQLVIEHNIEKGQRLSGAMCPVFNCADEECERQQRERAAVVGNGFPFRGVSR